MSGFDASFLGLVQGLTEFLPVSSSGHLVVLEDLLGAQQEGILFEIVVHFATLASVLIFYRRRVGSLIAGTLHRKPEELQYIAKLVVATIPAVLLVVVWGDRLDAQFESPRVAGVGFLITGAILWTTRYTMGTARLMEPTWTAALLIGCAQALAIIPGISRSGSTVAAALALGVAPAAAAEFSFMMSVVAIAGAGMRAIPDLLAAGADRVIPMAVGAGVALATGVAAIWLFVRLLRTQSFHYFAFYTWAAGLFVLAWYG